MAVVLVQVHKPALLPPNRVQTARRLRPKCDYSGAGYMQKHLPCIPGWCGSVDELRYVNQRAASLIPSEGTYLGCSQVPRRGRARGNHTLLFLCLSFSHPSRLKINKIFRNKCLQTPA